MAEKHTTRIDKWLWAVRIFKTRVLTNKACAGGKVKIDSIAVKASRKIQIGNIVQVRKGVVKYMYKVCQISEKRIGAKLVPDFLEDITPEEELAGTTTVETGPASLTWYSAVALVVAALSISRPLITPLWARILTTGQQR